jgi:hypothetical protein
MQNRIIPFAVIAALGFVARADDNQRLTAVPWVYVGDAGDCGPGYPPGSNIVTSAWLRGMGLPDSGQPNTTAADTVLGSNGAASRGDSHYGLLLNKNGPTPDCSSAGASIHGIRGLTVGPAPEAAFVLGFDYRNGTHCGGGAPRFDVVARSSTGSSTFHFIGNCALGVRTPAPEDPLQWTRVRFANLGAGFPPIPPGSRIESIDLVFDEGTDVPGTEDPNGVGLSVVDNIFVNGQYIRSGRGIAEPDTRGNERD